MSEYIKGDYTKCYEDICEIWYEDNLYCIVRTDDADKLIDVLNENEQLKQSISHYANITACSIQVMNEDEELKKDYASILCTKMEELVKENEQLKQTISKIDFAIIRKYDNSLENLLDEVYDGEYNNWIQKQLLRAKKLEKGDVE